MGTTTEAEATAMHRDGDGDLAPSAWLARAREEAGRLADERGRQARPFRVPQQRAASTGPTWRPAAVLATVALALLCTSGAWALVARARRHKEPARRPAPAAAAPAPSRAPANASPPPGPVAPRVVEARPLPAPRLRTRSPARVAPRPTTPAPAEAPSAAARPDVGTPALEGPEVELIVVPRHPPQEPLFSPEEWRQQGPRGGRSIAS